MPLPPAPTHRASRLTHKAFESTEEQTDAPALVQIETKRSLTSEITEAPIAKRPARVRKNEAQPLAPKSPEPRQVTGGKRQPESIPLSAGTAREISKPAPARTKRRSGPSKLFVLDTNVLMHDPMSLFRFEEHDVFLPMIVLEELDGHKKGMTEVARNARQASRSLDTLASAQGADLGKGSPLNATGHTDAMGQLFFQTQALDLSLPLALPQGKADNQILGVVKALGLLHAPRDVVLVSKDINMRVKARALGLQAEDYQNDKTLEDGDLLYPGSMALPQDFWIKNGKTVESWQQGAHTFYRISGPIVPSLFMNQFVYFEAPGEPSLYARVTEIRGKTAVLRTLKDFNHQKNAVWGVTTRNREQNFAMNLLTDPDIDFVTLAGTAGTGKTLMAL
ncbi:MAG: PIN domain-containing protein, partial [Limnohabitans sp.]|nr:PIN domain-containing protein [Limnohabitans sp.]